VTSPRIIIVVVAAAALALTAAAAAPRPARAVSFVDKQVQAGSLLIQKYVNDYGQDNRFVYPARTMVKKGGGLTAPIWPANPWTGKIMGPGSSRGSYTYTPSEDGSSYKLVVRLSKGNYRLSGGLPKWLKTERNTASQQNALLLQRYLDAYRVANGAFPATGDFGKATLTGYVWPLNPWTGADMVAGAALGDYSYTRDGDSAYTLKVKLTTGWSTGYSPVSVLSRLTVAPGS
jgi:type II secretory pathway pseudopilin PulG